MEHICMKCQSIVVNKKWCVVGTWLALVWALDPFGLWNLIGSCSFRLPASEFCVFHFFRPTLESLFWGATLICPIIVISKHAVFGCLHPLLLQSLSLWGGKKNRICFCVKKNVSNYFSFRPIWLVFGIKGTEKSCEIVPLRLSFMDTE